MKTFRKLARAGKRRLSKRSRFNTALIRRTSRNIEPLETRALLSGTPFTSDSAWYDSAGTIDMSIRTMLASSVTGATSSGSTVPGATETSTFETSFTATEESSASDDSGSEPVVSPLAEVTDVVSYRLEAQDAITGDPITNIIEGEDFVLAVFVTDVRTPPAAENGRGVAAGYLNVDFNTLASIDGGASITYDDFFPLVQTGDLTTPGKIVGAGAFTSSLIAPGNAEQDLWSVPMHADAAGVLLFTSSFDTLASHDTLAYSLNDAVPEGDIEFGTYELTVLALGTPNVSIDNVTEIEGTDGAVDTPFVFTATLSETSALTVNVAFSTAAGTAAVGDDFVGNSGTLTFDPGVTEQFITVMVKADALDEFDEGFTVNLSDPTNVAIVDGIGDGTITDDDDPPSVSIGNVTLAEGDSGTTDFVFTATLSDPSGKEVTVLFATSDETAKDADDDYEPTSGTITFAPGDTSQAVTVTVNGDTVDEDEETFNVILSGPVNATLGDAAGLGTITNDDDPPSVSIDNNVTQAEGNSGTTDFLFTATLSSVSGKEVTVLFATSDGSATEADNDYVSKNETITFAPGDTSQVVTVTVNGDTVDEDEESFNVTLSNPNNATLGDAARLGTITNDDVLPSVSIGDVTQAEGDVGTTDFLFTVTLTNASASEITVEYSTVDGSASAGSDYELKSGTITFAPGSTSEVATVVVNGDTVDEIDETFTVNLASPVNAEIGDGAGTGTITDDDEPPSVSIGTATSVIEGDTAASAQIVFTATLSGESGNEVTVEYSTADDTATAGSDYTAQSGTLTFAPGTTSQLVTITVDGDTIEEFDEDFTVDLANPVNATLGTDSVIGTITDDDEPPSVSIGDVTQSEGDSGTTEFLFTAMLSGPSGKEVTVEFATSDGTAEDADNDYEPTSGAITFAPGETSQVVTVVVNGDTIDEADEETFNVTLSTPVNATLDDAEGLGTILDDDDPPSVSVSSFSMLEGNAGPTDFLFTVSLSSISGQQVTVEFTTNDGTATDADNDYEPTSGTITFEPGDTSQVVTVAVNGDIDEEQNEGFQLALSNPSNATLSQEPNQGLGTILNDDGPHLSFMPSGVSQSEGDSGTTEFVFTVDIGESNGSEVTVVYTTVDGTATAGSDYVAQSGTLTFSPSDTIQFITVAVNGDTIDEPEEAFTVVLSDPTNATILSDTATGTIINDDEPPSVSIGTETSVAEGDTAASAQIVFTATLSSESGKTVTVEYSTADDTATAGSDYTAQSGTLTFAPGTISQFVTITVNGDTFDEPDEETFNVTLSDPVNATLGDADGVGTILDDDDPPSVSIDDLTQAEGDNGTTEFVFTATLSDPSGKTVTVEFATSDGTATDADNDYEPTSGTITFAPGITSQVVTVLVNGDTFAEDEETFNVTLSNPDNATLGDDAAIGTITNDDDVILSIGNASVDEADDGQTSEMLFTVNLSTTSDQTVTVEFDIPAGGTATSGVDYVNTSGTLTFEPGETSQIITVVVNGDLLNEANEDFTVRLFNSTNASNAQSEGTAITAEGTILNDDSVPNLTFTPSAQNAAEGDSGSTEVVFTATLSEVSGQQVLVQFQTNDSQATASDGDYDAISGTLTFAPGETEKLITVLVNGDTKFEAAETFSIDLMKIGDTVNLSDVAVIVSITADDPAPRLSIGNVSMNEGNSGDTDFVFTVSLDGESGLPVTVDFATAPGTALTNEDFTGQAGTLTFAAGTTEQLITVKVHGDTANEADETFTVNLSNVDANGVIAQGTGTGTILTDDTEVSIGNVTQVEGDSGTTAFVFEVTRTNGSGGTVTVVYNTADGTATAPDDYQAASGTLTFAPGVTSLNVTVNVVGDIFQEPDETFFVNLSAPTGASIDEGQGTGTIQNGDDDIVVIPSSLSGFAFIDSDNGHDMDPAEAALPHVTVTLLGTSSTTNESVEMTTTTGADGFYSFNVDPGTYNVAFTQPPTYQAGQTSIGSQGGTIAANGLSYTSTIASPGDVEGTGNHFFVRGLLVEFISQRGFLASSANATLPGVSISDVSQAEGGSGTTAFVFTATLSKASAETLAVAFSTIDGTAVMGDDFVGNSGTLTFAPAVTEQLITVMVNADAVGEDDENFTVRLSDPANLVITDATGTGTIEDDDGAPSVSIGSVTQLEGDSGTTDFVFTATLSSASGGTVTVEFATSDAAATAADNDYDPTSGTITFAPGVISQAVTVTVNGDTVDEDNETFNITLSNPTNATLGASSGFGAIANDDAAPLAATAAPETFTQDGSVVTVHGTAGNDTFEFTAGAMHSVTINGVTNPFDPAVVTDIVFDGAGGDDKAKLVGSDGDDVADFGLGFGILTSSNYKVTVGNVNSISVNGGGGNDTATLQDSIFNDDLVALDNETTLANNLGQAATLLAFELVRAISSSGGDDTAFVGALDFTLEQEGAWTDL